MKQLLAAAAALVALVVFPAASWAQAKPDLSGNWTLDQAKSDPAPARGGGGAPGGGAPDGGAPGGGGGGQRGGGGGRGGGGRGGGGVAMSMTIKQTPAELSIDRTMGQGSQTAVYKLDGSESSNTMGMGEAKSKATWTGPALVITTTQTAPGRGGETMTIDVKEVYSLEGGNLVVLRTQTTPMGAQTRKLVYTK